jgi:uncharacterized membrane protein YeiH
MTADVFVSLPTVLDLASAAVFATTGALVAARKELDIIGSIWLGVVTGVGGGTLRDLLLDVPVFWVADPAPLVVCIAVAVAVHVGAHLLHAASRWILWLDAVGLALVTVAGTAKGLAIGAAPVVAVSMGVITACVGGIVRDVLGQEPSILLRREIYVTASAMGAVAYVVLVAEGSTGIAAAVFGAAITFVVRGLALVNGWSLPALRLRPRA